MKPTSDALEPVAPRLELAAPGEVVATRVNAVQRAGERREAAQVELAAEHQALAIGVEEHVAVFGQEGRCAGRVAVEAIEVARAMREAEAAQGHVDDAAGRREHEVELIQPEPVVVDPQVSVAVQEAGLDEGEVEPGLGPEAERHLAAQPCLEVDAPSDGDILGADGRGKQAGDQQRAHAFSIARGGCAAAVYRG